MTEKDLIELREYARTLGFNVFEIWDKDEYTIAMPQHKVFSCMNWIIDCTYNKKTKMDIILKNKLENYMETVEIENYKTYRVEYLNLDTMKRWLDLMLKISKKYEIKKKLEKIKGDF